MCRHYRSGPRYREPSFDVPSRLQQVFIHSICVGEFARFSSTDAKLIQIQVVPSAHLRASLGKITASLSSSLLSFSPACVSLFLPLGPAPWCSAHCWAATGEVVVPHRMTPTAPRGACPHEAQHVAGAGVQPKQPLSHPHSGLSCNPRPFLACTCKMSVPISCSSLQLHVRVQQQQH